MKCNKCGADKDLVYCTCDRASRSSLDMFLAREISEMIDMIVGLKAIEPPKPPIDWDAELKDLKK